MEPIDLPEKRITKLYAVDYWDSPLAGVLALGEYSDGGQSNELAFDTIAMRHFEHDLELRLAEAWPVPAGCVDQLLNDATHEFADRYLNIQGPKQQTLFFRGQSKVEQFTRHGGFFHDAALWRPKAPVLWILFQSTKCVLRAWNVTGDLSLGVDEMRYCLFNDQAFE